MSMKLPTLLWAMLLLGLLSGCATNPVTGDTELALVSQESELEIGRKQYVPSRQMQGGDYTLDPALTRYVREVGNNLVAVSDRNLPYEFAVVNDSSPNAWALPGGKIAVNRGLLVELQNEAELAAVLGHEIVHAAARHSAQGIERGILLQGAMIAAGIAARNSRYSDVAVGAAVVGASLINQRYSRDAEIESDYYGMRYMQRAGYNPGAAVGLQETFVRLSKGENQSWLNGLFASHPPSPERVAKNRETMKELGTEGRIGRDRYQQMIAGLKRNQPAYQAYDEGVTLLDQQPQKALVLAERAISIEPREGLFHGLRGDALLKQNRPEEARKSYGRAIAMNPDFFRPYLKRGAVRAQLGDKVGARSDLQRSLQLLPTAEGHYMLGQINHFEGDQRAAVQNYRIAAKSKSPAGKAANKELMNMQLARNPGGNLDTLLGRDRTGNLLVQITNNSDAAVRDLVVLVGRKDASGGIYRGEEHRLDTVLRPGEKIRFKTGIRGLTSRDQLKYYAARVVQRASTLK